MKNGFSLIELMATVAIVAIVVAIGTPSFVGAIKNNRLTGQLNSLIGALSYARSEAAKQGQNSVTICGSNDSATCNSDSWETGWIIFRDGDSNGAVGAGEPILRISEALNGNNTLRTTGFATAGSISFNNLGMVNSIGSLVLCDDRGASDAKAIVINISGQSRVATDDNNVADDIVNIHDGSNVACPI